jgi:cytochrome c5
MSSEFILRIHLASVTAFLLFYLVKTFFLLSGRHARLDSFTKNTRIIEMAFSALFLTTGIWLISLTGGLKSLQIVKLVLVFASIPLAVVGFKKRVKVLVSCSLLMLIVAYGLAEAGRSKPYPVKHAPTEEANAGKYIFEHNCVQCHGQNGKKAYLEAADLSLSVKDASLTSAIIRNGSNKKMPAYGGILSDEEIKSVTDYIITLRE